MSAKEVVAAYWAAAEARDWDAFGTLVAEDVLYEVPKPTVVAAVSGAYGHERTRVARDRKVPRVCVSSNRSHIQRMSVPHGMIRLCVPLV